MQRTVRILNWVSSTQNQAFNAIAFFSRNVVDNRLHALCAMRPVHLRHLVTVSEIQRSLQAIRNLISDLHLAPVRRSR